MKIVFEVIVQQPIVFEMLYPMNRSTIPSIPMNRISNDFGISGPVLNWLRSFVTGCSQYIAVGPSAPSVQHVSLGFHGVLSSNPCFSLCTFHRLTDDLQLHLALLPNSSE